MLFSLFTSDLAKSCYDAVGKFFGFLREGLTALSSLGAQADPELIATVGKFLIF